MPLMGGKLLQGSYPAGASCSEHSGTDGAQKILETQSCRVS